MQQLTTTTVPVGDIEIACTYLGDGPPLVCCTARSDWAVPTCGRSIPGLTRSGWSTTTSGKRPHAGGRRTPGLVGGGIEDLEGLRRARAQRVALLGHSAGAYLAALYAADHPDRTSALVFSTRDLPSPGPDDGSGRPTAPGGHQPTKRPPCHRGVSGIPGPQPGCPRAAPAQHLLPFFKDRASLDDVDLGFTDITAANVQDAPARMMGGLGSLDPWVGSPASAARLSSSTRSWPDPARVSRPSPGRSPARNSP